jgi:integrase
MGGSALLPSAHIGIARAPASLFICAGRFCPNWRTQTPHPAANEWVFASPYTKGKRPYWPAQLMKAHIKPVALSLGLPSIGWHSFRHMVSAWGKEAGLELEEVKTLLRHEDLATTSEVCGDLGMPAKRRIQQQLVDFVKKQATDEEDRLEISWPNPPSKSIQ